MDSVTQIVLGGAVGYAVLGDKVGRKAAIYGAVLGTVPDLDVFLPYGGSVEEFTYHRGFSHSVLMQLLISPIIAWLIVKCHPATYVYRRAWFYLVFLCFSTHSLLDSFTVYGTQLLWPITEYPFGLSNLFIIDPLYTLPLLIGFLYVLLVKQNTGNKLTAQTVEHRTSDKLRSNIRASKINSIALTVSTIYVVWSIVAKVYIDNTVSAALAQRQINGVLYLSTPAPFTTLLWRVLVMTDTEYYEGYVSVFDDANNVTLYANTSSDSLLNSISDKWEVERLQWFTKGFYGVSQNTQQQVILSDLRMGSECNYVFNFVVGEQTNAGVVAGSFEKLNTQPDISSLGSIWDRIFDPNVSLIAAKQNGVCLDE